MKIKISDIIIVIVAAVMLFSGYKVITISKESKQAEKQYRQLEQMTHIEKTEESEDTAVTAKQKYQSIYDLNNDFIGWIYIPGTELNYPVMHTPSNPEYYLRKDFDGKYSIQGVPFVDYRCTVDESDNTVVYGHNMMNGTMFSAVESYADKNFWQNHRYMGFDTMNGYGTYEIALCARMDLLTIDFNYTDTINFNDELHFYEYISKVKEHACYETDVELEYGDKLLLLSTCETRNDNGRYVIIAKKISDEDLSVSQ